LLAYWITLLSFGIMLIKSSIKRTETSRGVKNVSPNVFLIQEPI
jgi:hypothetical protein